MRIGKIDITLPFYPAAVVFEPKKTHSVPQKLILSVITQSRATISQKKKADGILFVWTVANDSTAHRTVVTTGETTGNRIVVATGLNDGNRIVTEGYQKLSEGTKVVF